MIWYLIAAGSGSLITGLVVWLVYREGKREAEGKAAAKAVIALELQATERNQFIRDVDEISKRKDEAKKAVHDAFDRGDVTGIVRALDSVREDPAADTAKAPS